LLAVCRRVLGTGGGRKESQDRKDRRDLPGLRAKKGRWELRDCKGQPDHKAGRAKKAIQGRRDRRVRKVLPVPKVQTARSRKRVSFSSHMPRDSIDVAAKRASTRPVINRWGPPRNLRRELSRDCGWSAITFQQTQRLRLPAKRILLASRDHEEPERIVVDFPKTEIADEKTRRVITEATRLVGDFFRSKLERAEFWLEFAHCALPGRGSGFGSGLPSRSARPQQSIEGGIEDFGLD
jgi:hypothetical protein